MVLLAVTVPDQHRQEVRGLWIRRIKVHHGREHVRLAHAAVTFALGDSAAGYAALSTMAPEDEVMTAEMKINLLAPAAGQRLKARGHVIKAGRRLVVVGATVEAIDGDRRRDVAVLQGTMVPVGG